MSAQKRELQMISVQRNRDSRTTQYKKRKRRRQRRRRLGIWGVCAVVLIGSCLVTNRFTEVPIVGKDAKIAYLKEQGNYPTELIELVEKNEEAYDFVKDYPNREKYQNEKIELSEDYQKGKVPLLMQWDKRWGYDLYGDAMIALSGCGPTCMTMAYVYYTDDVRMHPKKMAAYAQKQGYHVQEGTSWEFWTKGAEGLGLQGEEISLNRAVMEAVLDSGGLIVCSMSPGDFTDGGHYILLRGYDEKGFFVNDPNRKSNSKKQWDYETLCGQIKNLWAIYKA